jgi:hypothetical protein
MEERSETRHETVVKGSFLYLSIGLSIALVIALILVAIAWRKNAQLAADKAIVEARLFQAQQAQEIASAEPERALGLTREQRGPCSEDSFDACADVGYPLDEIYHQMSGWGENEIGGPVVPPSNDPSKRYQPLRGQASLVIKVPKAGVPYILHTEVEDGGQTGCDDSWAIYVNDQGPLFTYMAAAPSEAGLAHQIAILADVVVDDEITITYHNLSGDDCGLAAVFNVRLEPAE